MNTSTNRFIWIITGIALGALLTGTIFLFWGTPLWTSSVVRTLDSSPTVEHKVSRPDPPGPSEEPDSAIEAIRAESVSIPPKTEEPEREEPQNSTFAKSPNPSTRQWEGSNPDFERLSEEARQLLDVILKLDFTSQPLPEYAPLLKQLADTARSAEELKTALGLKEAFANAVRQVEEKRQVWFLAELGKIQSGFDQLRAVPVVSADSLRRRAEEFLHDCKALREKSPKELEARCDKLTGDINAFVRMLTENDKLYAELSTLDKTESIAAMEEGLRRIASRYPNSDYAKSLTAVLATFPALAALDEWNKFVEENGRHFDLFAVRPGTIAAANAFFHQHGRDLGFLPEWKTLHARLRQLQGAAKDLPVNEKIVPLLRHAGSRPFWIYKKTPNQWFYLTHPPQTGSNRYLADLFGAEKIVTIPNDAVAAITEATSVAFFRELAEKTSCIEDDLRYEDTGKWYAAWCDTINALRVRKDLDPVVQFLFLKDICSVLAATDTNFARRLAPWLRVLNSTDFAAGVDWYDAEGKKTGQLRATAAQLLRFLQDDLVSVSKSTEDLNRMIKPVSFEYARLGWLDRTPSGAWFCRPVSERPARTDGELFVLLPSPEQQPERFISIGRISEGKPTVELASNDLIPGLPVVVRFPAQ